MFYIILGIAIFFLIGHFSKENIDVNNIENNQTEKPSYTMRTQGKFIYLDFSSIPQNTETVYLDISYQSQPVRSYHDFFNDDKGNFITGTHDTKTSIYSVAIPVNALMLPRNKNIPLTFNIVLFKDRQFFNRFSFEENITINANSFLMMEWFVPAIQILSYYSIKEKSSIESRAWIKQNIKVIKEVFMPHIEDCKEEQDFLKNYIKHLSRVSIDLETCIKDFNSRCSSKDEKNTVFYGAATIIINNLEAGIGSDIQSSIAEVKRLGKLMQVDKAVVFKVCADFEYIEETSATTKSNDTQKALATLGLSEGATTEEMRRAYRLKIKDFHPDKYISLPESVQALLKEKAQELNLAKETLRF